MRGHRGCQQAAMTHVWPAQEIRFSLNGAILIGIGTKCSVSCGSLGFNEIISVWWIISTYRFDDNIIKLIDSLFSVSKHGDFKTYIF